MWQIIMKRVSEVSMGLEIERRKSIFNVGDKRMLPEKLHVVIFHTVILQLRLPSLNLVFAWIFRVFVERSVGFTVDSDLEKLAVVVVGSTLGD